MVRALSWRSVRARKVRALLNGLGIVLGVALFFSVLSLSQTIVSTFDELFSSVYGETDFTIAAGANGQATLSQSLLSQVQGIDGVAVARPSVDATMALVRKPGAPPSQKDTVYVSGVRPGDPNLSGSTTIAGPDDVVAGQLRVDSGWAKNNKVKVGDTLSFATTSGVKRLKVSGIYALQGGLEFGGQGFATTDMESARRLFDIPRGYSQIQVKVAEGRAVAGVRKEVEAIVPTGVQVNAPSDIADAINSQLQGFNVILYFFAAMSLFVGGFLILNTFNMTVAQRLREIGMLRALGASRGLVRNMILLEAALIGIIGALAGIVLGLLLTKMMVWLVTKVGFAIGDVKYPLPAFVIAPFLGVGATVLGALRPAVHASRIPPIQAVLAEHRARPLPLARRLTAGVVLTLIGLLGVFTLAASSDTPPPVVAAGVIGVILLFTGVIMIGPVLVPALTRVIAWPLLRAAPVEGRLAADNTRTNPARTASTASGLMIGVALVAAIGSIGASFIGTISGDLEKELKTDFTIQSRGPQGGGPQAFLALRSLEQVRELPATGIATGVKAIDVTAGQAKGQMLYGVDPELQGRFATPQYEPGAVKDVAAALAGGAVTLPASFAKEKNLAVGDSILIAGPRGRKKLEIAALVKGTSMEARTLVSSLETFDSLYGVNGFSRILAIARSADQRPALGREIDRLLARDYPAFESLSNQQLKQRVKDQTNQLFSIFYVIMIVAILVSLLGVVNTLLMSVFERTREIGLLRAIGTGRWQVRRMVVAESVLITTAGAVLGLVVGMALGWAFVRGISSGDTNVAFHPPVAVIVAVAVLSVIAGIIAAIPPARRAARMNVIESLSYE